MSTPVCAFDAYGTLFDFNTASLAAADLGDQAAALRELWRTKQLQYFWLRTLQGEYRDFETVTAEALDTALATLGLTGRGIRRQLLALFAEIQSYPETADALAALKGLGVRLVIHTNAGEQLVRRSLQSSGLNVFFDEVVSIEHLGLYKPHPAAYGLLAQRLRLDPGEITFVSSNSWDAHGAAHFGLRAAWVNRTDLPDDALPGRLHRVIPALTDLIPLFSAPSTR